MNLNLPNQLTVGRIVAIFAFLALANVQESSVVSGDTAHICHVIGYVLAIIAGLTDVFDGYIARKYNMVSDLGALLDPLADKIFLTTAAITMVEEKYMAAWMAVIIIAREFLVTGLRLIATQRGVVISADKWGKLKTLMQMLMLLVAGAAWIRLFDMRNGTVWGFRLWTLWQLYLYLVTGVTALSGFGYFYRHSNLLKEKN